MSVEVVFETHATSVDNELGIATGWLDGELSETGRAQAVQLGERRADADVVFVSDLGRAVETADIAFGGSDVPVHRDARLRECNYGEMNGAAIELVAVQRADRVDVPFPGGESYRQCVDRMREFLDEVARDYEGKRVVVIGHRATFYAFEHLVNGKTLEELIVEPPAWEPGRRYAVG